MGSGGAGSTYYYLREVGRRAPVAREPAREPPPLEVGARDDERAETCGEEVAQHFFHRLPTDNMASSTGQACNKKST